MTINLYIRNDKKNQRSNTYNNNNNTIKKLYMVTTPMPWEINDIMKMYFKGNILL